MANATLCFELRSSCITNFSFAKCDLLPEGKQITISIAGKFPVRLIFSIIRLFRLTTWAEVETRYRRVTDLMFVDKLKSLQANLNIQQLEEIGIIQPSFRKIELDD